MPLKVAYVQFTKRKCKWLTNEIKYSTSLIVKGMQKKKKKKNAMRYWLSPADQKQACCLKDCTPHRCPLRYCPTSTDFQESNLVISLKSPSVLFPAICPEAKWEAM